MDSLWVLVGVITSIWDSVQTTILLRPRSACTLNFSTILPAIWSLLCPPPDGLELTQNRTLVTAPDGAPASGRLIPACSSSLFSRQIAGPVPADDRRIT